MRYNILISYRTGDSFHSEDREDLLDGEWEDKFIVMGNLNRIKEHYEWYRFNNKHHGLGAKVEEPQWHKDRKMPENSVLLLTDKKVEYWLSAFWCGYFETLYGAKAILVKEEEIGFTI